VTRRQFLKYAGATAALLGLSEAMVPEIARALEGMAAGKPPVIWIQGQSCSGCAVSFLNTNYPMAAEVVLDKLSIRFQPTVMAAAGDVATKVIEDTVKELNGQYVLVVEGPVPTNEDGKYCTFGLEQATTSFNGYQRREDKPMTAWMDELVPGAAAVIALGNCASFGGIPAANADTTGTTAVQDYVAKVSKGTPVINVGGCPAHPDWFVGTVLNYLFYKKVPELDKYNRPTLFFGKLIHENCERRAAFDAGLFLEDWNDNNPDLKLCMFKMGCKGPVTYADCPTRRWNSGLNWCVGANGPCHGCAEPAFYKNLTPLYEPLPEMHFAGINPTVDTLGWIAAGATAVGIGGHYLYKQLGQKSEAEGGEE
jgi:NiFe hydrogenase small subunit HydA